MRTSRRNPCGSRSASPLKPPPKSPMRIEISIFPNSTGSHLPYFDVSAAEFHLAGDCTHAPMMKRPPTWPLAAPQSPAATLGRTGIILGKCRSTLHSIGLGSDSGVSGHSPDAGRNRRRAEGGTPMPRIRRALGEQGYSCLSPADAVSRHECS